MVGSKWWKKILFTGVVLLLALAAVELLLQHVRVGRPEEKLWIVVDGGYGLCFSSDREHRFPLSIRESEADRAYLRGRTTLIGDHPMFGNDDLTFADLVERAPHCILQSLSDRMAGPYPDRKVQAAVIGDSFAYGEGIPPEETVSHLLSQKLPEVNFRNLGAAGANLEANRARLQDTLKIPAVSSIIYLYNLNDVFLTNDPPPDMVMYPELTPLYPGWKERFRLVGIVRRLWLEQRRSALVTRAYLHRYTAPAAKARLDRAFNVLALMEQETRESGRPFLVVIYPLLHKTIWGGYAFEPAHRKVMAFCRDRHIRCVDGYDAFRADRSMAAYRIHRADSHPNGRANARLVDHLISTGSIRLK